MSNPTKSAATDWHPARIKMELELQGWSLRRLSKAHGYSDWAMKMALRKHWPAAEAIIAETIGRKPDEIWPSRYRDGKPIHPIRVHRRGPHAGKKSSPAVGGRAQS